MDAARAPAIDAFTAAEAARERAAYMAALDGTMPVYCGAAPLSPAFCPMAPVAPQQTQRPMTARTPGKPLFRGILSPVRPSSARNLTKSRLARPDADSPRAARSPLATLTQAFQRGTAAFKEQKYGEAAKSYLTAMKFKPTAFGAENGFRSALAHIKYYQRPDERAPAKAPDEPRRRRRRPARMADPADDGVDALCAKIGLQLACAEDEAALLAAEWKQVADRLDVGGLFASRRRSSAVATAAPAMCVLCI